jgi:two-component system, sensor histidine kinase and response regulator
LTDQPRDEDARAFLEAILASSDAAIIGRTLDGTIVSWNRAAELLYGYSAAEAIGRRDCASPVPGLRETDLGSLRFETVQLRKDGAPVHVALSISPVRNCAGEVTGTAVIASEIVARGIVDSQRASEAKFQSLFEDNPLPMWVYDCKTLRFLEVNDAAVAHYGYSRDEFLGMCIADIRPAEDIPRLERLLAGERPRIRQSGVWRHRLRDGNLIPVEIVSHRVDWNGRRAALVVAQDISDRTRAEEALRESEERFRTAFEHAPFGMCLSARDGRFLQVNAAFSQMLGYSERELLNGAWQNLTHPADLERSKQALQQFMSRQAISVEFEKRYVHKNGSDVWVRLKISIVNDPRGDPSHFITHVDDITARRRAERALQESEEKYRSLIAHIPDVVWVADAAGRVVFVSPNSERLIGLGADEVRQRGTCALFELIHPDDMRKAVGAFEKLFYGDQTYDVEFRVRAASGECVWVHDRAVSTYERDGVRYASGLRSDISERRRTEAALRERDTAEDANRTKSAFLANMSHELRTPLNAIIGYSQMLREDAIGPGQPEVLSDLEKIERSGHILLGIINDVLDLSKIEAGRFEIDLGNVDVADVLTDVCNAVEPLARHQGNVVSRHCPEDARLAFADLPKFRQSLLNLVNNACKFTLNGQVSAAVSRLHGADRDWIEVRVSDTGIGIRPEDLGKLFQPFSQVDNSATRKYDGTGLGLAISKKFCQMMGGDIAVESEPGKGSCFSLRVPAANGPENALRRTEPR